MNFDDLFGNWLILGLFLFASIAFIASIQSDNHASDPLINNSAINSSYGNLATNLRSYRDSSQSQKTAFESENPTAGAGSILLFSITSAGKIFDGMVVGVFNQVVALPVILLGADPIIISVISTLLIAAIIFGLWTKYKSGGG